MKKLLILVACLALTACAFVSGTANTQNVQASYVQACTALGAASYVGDAVINARL